MIQLNPGWVDGAVDDGFDVFVGVGVTDPVVVGERVGEGVVNGERMLNESLALRCVTISLASIVCRPIDHDGLMVIVTLNVPSLPALMVLLLATGIYACAEVSATARAASRACSA